MFIQPISNINKSNRQIDFKANPQKLSSFWDMQKFEEQMKQISKNPETRKLFTGLTTLAGAIIAEATLYLEKDKQAKNFITELINEFGLNNKQTEDIVNGNNIDKFPTEEIIENNPERELYLKVTSYFPNLDGKYKQMLQTQIKEPENEENNFILETIENTFKYFTDDNKLVIMKPYLNLMNDYSENIDDIAKNISSTIKNGKSYMYYFVLLNNGKLTREDIHNWAKAPNISCDEFMMFKNMGYNTISSINSLKKDTAFTIDDYFKLTSENGKSMYAFRLNFQDGTPVRKRLQTISKVHEALYGDIYLKGNNTNNDLKFLQKDIQTEMMDNIIKDRCMDSVYNFAKFIEPQTFKKIKLSSNDIKNLSKDDKDYKRIKALCNNIVLHLNDNNPRAKEFCDVMNNNDLFEDIITSRHARIRFLTRFVLKDNQKPKQGLENECKQKMEILKKALEKETNSCNYFCYIHPKGYAPQFYLKNIGLGVYVKITLNNNGTIHTIYEDSRKETKMI